MKILAVGMNYAEHINELHTKEEQNSLLNTEPVLFSKFDSSIIQPGKPFFVPDFAARFDYETEIVVKIAHVGKDISERFAHRYYNELTVGIDFTARELQKELREKGMPWECCKSFDGSAALGKFITKEELGCDVQDIHFHMDLNGECRQTGHTADMIHTIDHIIAYASKFFTLKTGDLIFTGTPVGVGPVKEGDRIEAYIGERKLLNLKVK
ncbi:MAG: fumarylacetoacetate hydrolase family protein [Bacteroidaceae bacterium]|nr:fumarylacetoacetate hydrolase family protein [Bacteroidaceae bacterium]